MLTDELVIRERYDHVSDDVEEKPQVDANKVRRLQAMAEKMVEFLMTDAFAEDVVQELLIAGLITEDILREIEGMKAKNRH